MFSQIFFLFLTLILMNFATEIPASYWIENPKEAFEWGLLCYALLLFFIGLQATIFRYIHRKIQSFWSGFINIEILFFLALFYFGLGGHRIFLENSSYQTPLIFSSLILYFFALGWIQFSYSYFCNHMSIKKGFKSGYRHCLFYFPFTIPFIMATLFLDGWSHFFSEQSDTLLLLGGIAFIGLTFLFLPPLMMRCWGCRSLNPLDLNERLEKLCSSLQFRHAGLKTWSMLPHAFTAGIIGIIPFFRYILFTPPLVQRFQPEEVEAILIHEIGHNHHRHLLCYPLILLGMLMSGALLLMGLEDFFFFVHPSSSSDTVSFLLIITFFGCYAAAMGLYFRFIFGFFSRLFERQADLHIFSTSLSPLALVKALDRLGVVTGYTHDQPSWHHFSLQERIGFLYQAMDNPTLVTQHHRKVKLWLIIYLFALILGLTTLQEFLT